MSWQRRLVELAVAGGLAWSCGGSSFQPPVCNASPDPCCGDDTTAVCQAYRACQAKVTAQCCAEAAWYRFSFPGCLPDGGVADGGSPDGGPSDGGVADGG